MKRFFVLHRMVLYALAIFLVATTGTVHAQITKLKDYTNKYSAPIGTHQGIAVREGGFSGMCVIPNTNGTEYWVVSDRGPNIDCGKANPVGCTPTYDKMYAFPNYAPKIHRVRLSGDSVQILQTIVLRRPGGAPASGLLNPTGFGSTAAEMPSTDTVLNCANYASKLAAKDVWGVDSEGILVDKDGNFWLCDEGGACIWKVNPDGMVLKRYTPYAQLAGSQPEDFAIDTVFGYRKNNRGFESICMTPNGKIYALIQSPLLYPTVTVGEASRIHRLLEIDPSSGATRMFAYLNDGIIGSGSNQIRLKDWKTGDMAAINDSTFLVLEAAARGTTDIKRMYLINIAAATPVHSGLYGTQTLEALVDSVGMASKGLVAVRKTLFMDLLANGWPSSYDKAEGLSIINDSTIAICNDNDYALTCPAENGVASATNLPCHVVTFLLRGANKIPKFVRPAFMSQATSAPGLDYSFVVVGCNRVEDVDSVGNPSTANVYQLNRMFSELAAMNPLPKYLFFAGDMVLGYEADTVKLASQLSNWLSLYKASPLASLPVTLVAIPGNHETQNKAAGKKSFVAAERTFQRVMYDYLAGNNGPTITGLLPGSDSLTTDQSKLSYSFDYKNDHFVILNTDPVGRDGIASYKWATNDIMKARANGVRHVFAIGHKPAYTGHFKSTADGLEVNPAQRDSLWNAFEAHQVDAFFSAHVHCADSIQPHPAETWQIIAGNGGSLVESLFQSAPNAYFGYTVVNVYASNRVNVKSMGRDAVMTPAAYQNATPANPTTVRASYDIQVNPTIEHTPLVSTNSNGPFTIVATIKDNAAVTNALLNYRVNGGILVSLVPAISGSTYTFVIPAQTSVGTIQYNIQANDISQVKIYSSGSANAMHSFDFGYDLITGVSTLKTPYMTPLANGVKLTSILTVQDSIGGYMLAGLPDGLGAFDNNDGTFTLLVNHEMGGSSGAVHAHGSVGAFVSKWVINKSDLRVISGSDLIKNVMLWNGSSYTTYNASNPSSLAAFNRFCAADLPPTNAFYNPLNGLGTQEKLFLNGEEAGDNGRLFAHIASGPNAGNSYELPHLGKYSCENLLARPVQADKTVVVGLDDSTPGQVYVYVGTKVSTGTEIDKAGLTNGRVYGISVKDLPSEISATAPAPNTEFTMVDLGVLRDSTGTAINALSTAKNVTRFLRPEDGAWDPSNPLDFYFNTTNSFSAPSRLWRLRFTSLANPELGGTITAVLDGTEGIRMLDNMVIDKSGHILLQEDVGNNVHNGKVWQYTIATDSLKVIAQHDSTRFVSGGSNYLTQDEESSGIIDMQSILGPGMFILAAQGHYAIPGAAVEGGQLLVLTNPDSYNGAFGTKASSSQTPYLTPVAPAVSFSSLLTVQDPAKNGYRLTGLPDGLGAFDNNDGTFTLLMTHEINAGLGAVRAHGSNGAFVSKWIINKSNLSVQSGSDLIRNVNLWNGKSYTTFSMSNPSPLASFSRFCSADLPTPLALYNPASGNGTQERIFMNGEEAGDNGRMFAHIVTGPMAGTTYELPTFGKYSCENLLARPMQSDKTVVAGLDDSTPGQVYFYIGTKTKEGTEIDRAGYTNGRLYGVAVSGMSAESSSSIPGANTTFRLVDLGVVRDSTGAALNTMSNVKGVTTFLRPEDGAWDPSNPRDFYFNTTNSFSSPSRVWRLRFNNVDSPEAGGTITAVIDGTEGVKMLDNMCMDNYGHILLQEDVGNNVHNGKVWQYTVATDSLKLLAQHDGNRFIAGGVNFLTQDEEASGVIDMQSILGPGQFLLVDQAHYPIPGEAVEGGQLLQMFNPDSYASALGAGPSSSQTPFLSPLAPGVQFNAIVTTGDVVAGGYKMIGLPDGLGAFDNNNGTFTLLVSHEISAGLGVTRAHGSNGAFVSKWVINKNDLSVVSASDLIRNVKLWGPTGYTTYNSSNPSPLASFSRFCSSDLAPQSAFFNAASGNGTSERLFLNGEEAGDNGRLFAHIASGVNSGTTYELPFLGKYSCENILACPVVADKTIVVGLDDSTPGQVYVYVGNKTNAGTEIDKAGLTNGKLYGVGVNGMVAEQSSFVTSPNTSFSLIDLGFIRDTNGVALNTISNQRGVTTFLRPEDGAWDPSSPNDFYFATTNSFSAPSRLWRLRFQDISKPEQGGTITAVLDGTEGQKMLDNLCIDNYGHILLQEDVGNNAHNGKFWQYTIANDELTLLAQHDTTRFIAGGSRYLTQDEESSGIIDVQNILGAGKFIVTSQAHYSIPGDVVEGGQLLVMTNPTTLATSAEISVKGNNIDIVRNSNQPQTLNNTDFGEVVVGQSSLRRYVIYNTGGTDLQVKSITFTGAANSEFSIAGNVSFPLRIAKNSYQEVIVQFTALDVSIRSAQLTINSNDFDEALYSFGVQGTGVQRTLVVKGNYKVVPNGRRTVSGTDNTDFGTVVLGKQVINSFLVVNAGKTPLRVQSISLEGADAAAFSLSSLSSNQLNAAQSQVLNIEFEPTRLGKHQAIVRVISNDDQQTDYSFSIEGNAVAATASVVIYGNSNVIADGLLQPNTATNTEFGIVEIGKSKTHSFELRNTGTADLRISDASFKSVNRADFSIVNASSFPWIVAAGETKTMSVQFKPTVAGDHNATLTVSSNDKDHASYDFSVHGNGLQIINDVATEGTETMLQLTPQPATDMLSLSYVLETEDDVQMEVIDELGRVLNQQVFVHRSAGSHTEHFSTAHLSAGLYQIRLRTAHTQAVAPLVIVR